MCNRLARARVGEWEVSDMVKANQDIRDYMADNGVTQKMLAAAMNVSQFTISKRLNTELSQKDKEEWLNYIDSIASDANEKFAEADDLADEYEDCTEDTQETEQEDVSVTTKFQIGDRVKIPSKANKTGIVSDIWTSLAKAVVMYAVENEDDGYCGMYAEDQLELAPIPTDYRFEACIDGNVAVVTMIATQGEKTWVCARGHAHILHNGEVGMAQAISYASKRMFESLDKKQENQIYFKPRGTSDDQ